MEIQIVTNANEYKEGSLSETILMITMLAILMLILFILLAKQLKKCITSPCRTLFCCFFRKKSSSDKKTAQNMKSSSKCASCEHLDLESGQETPKKPLRGAPPPPQHPPAVQLRQAPRVPIAIVPIPKDMSGSAAIAGMSRNSLMRALHRVLEQRDHQDSITSNDSNARDRRRLDPAAANLL